MCVSMCHEKVISIFSIHDTADIIFIGPYSCSNDAYHKMIYTYLYITVQVKVRTRFDKLIFVCLFYTVVG